MHTAAATGSEKTKTVQQLKDVFTFAKSIYNRVCNAALRSQIARNRDNATINGIKRRFCRLAAFNLNLSSGSRAANGAE